MQRTPHYPQHEFLRIEISHLVPHEGILDSHLQEIRDWIEKDNFQLRPIAVSRLDSAGKKWTNRFVIHDGHHRTVALSKLGCSFVMCCVFDFSDPRVKVFGYYDTSIRIPKEAVISRATSGKEITPRFDKHFIEVEGDLVGFHDNPILEPEMPTKLQELK